MARDHAIDEIEEAARQEQKPSQREPPECEGDGGRDRNGGTDHGQMIRVDLASKEKGQEGVDPGVQTATEAGLDHGFKPRLVLRIFGGGRPGVFVLRGSDVVGTIG